MSELKYKEFTEKTEKMPKSKFSNVPLEGLPLAMAYVPMQQFGELYSESEALTKGTAFPDLDKPFCGRFTGVHEK